MRARLTEPHEQSEHDPNRSGLQVEKEAHDDRHDKDQVAAERIGFATFPFKRRARPLSAWNLIDGIHTDDEDRSPATPSPD